MNDTIVLLQKESDFLKFENEIKKYDSPKIFSLDYESHIYLEKNNLKHELGENFLLKSDFDEIDNLTKKFIDTWIPEKLKSDFSINNIFLPNLIEHELFFYLLPIFSAAMMIKKIIKNENPRQVIDLTQFSEFTETFIVDKLITKISPIKKKLFYHDNVSINFSLMKFPINFKISKNTIVNIKKLSTSITDKILNSNTNKDSKKNILLVNFDPIRYEILLSELKNHNINTILYNPRKPPITNLKSFNIIKNSNCKVFNHYDAEKEILSEIETQKNTIKKSLENHFDNADHFESILDPLSPKLWNSIKSSFREICT